MNVDGPVLVPFRRSVYFEGKTAIQRSFRISDASLKTAASRSSADHTLLRLKHVRYLLYLSPSFPDFFPNKFARAFRTMTCWKFGSEILSDTSWSQLSPLRGPGTQSSANCYFLYVYPTFHPVPHFYSSPTHQVHGAVCMLFGCILEGKS
ncbi:hypothetical protein GALMADRAFT_229146 [Galerina marginata CBS 339.88]|uniref:Uncharacterized protein n=1 Tax=Galerina marginata (strain CBS 339.88) TaxID=685588 RepID=A0A067SQQ5_GALM3|nr:hypothetical protein GALMADRAFT_229146 [Galerina marginata CBS 339.88]